MLMLHHINGKEGGVQTQMLEPGTPVTMYLATLLLSELVRKEERGLTPFSLKSLLQYIYYNTSLLHAGAKVLRDLSLL